MNIKLKRVLSRIGLVLLAIIVIVLGIRAVLNFTTGKKLQAYLEDAKAKGIPISLKEVAPQCADDDNAASLWKAAETLFVIPEGEDKGVAIKALINRTIEDFYYARTLKPESREKLAALADKNRRSLELMLEASEKPCFRYGDWTKRIYVIDQLSAVKTILATRLLGIDSVFRADAGQIQPALGQLRQGMSFVSKTMDEPFLMNNLVALANMKSLLVCFDLIVSGRAVDSEVLTAWMKELDPEPWRKRFWPCIEAERLASLESGLDVIRGDGEALRAFESERNRQFYWLSRPVLKSQIVWVQNQYLDLQKKGVLPYFEIKELTEDKWQGRESSPWYYKMSGLLFTDFRSVFLKEATLEAMMLTTKAGLACKIYKKQSGHYPEGLDALVPELLDKVPIDPFTGQPLIYRLQDGGVLIYSVGSNGKDDNGRGTWQITQLVMPKDDDWAWSEK